MKSSGVRRGMVKILKMAVIKWYTQLQLEFEYDSLTIKSSHNKSVD